jgi:hypothetical protein
MTLEEFDTYSAIDALPSGFSSHVYTQGTISTSNPYSSTERQTMATEILKGMVNSGLVESPEDMAKDAVRLADALLAELRK